MANDDGGDVDYYYDEQAAEEVERFCKVYDSEDFFTVFVQMMLAAFALLSLWFKRQGETPRRKFRTWFLDISKQGLGACYAHVLNMVCIHGVIGFAARVTFCFGFRGRATVDAPAVLYVITVNCPFSQIYFLSTRSLFHTIDATIGDSIDHC